MLKKFFSLDSKPGAFFRNIDWTAFWSATIIAFLVYFFTLGPSVGLEDSGELATAGDHLGVPHPPGYPFWTLCSWIFCRLFSWVTYQGHPTPAWAISCLSAVFGAFAAGCTAMLITRSGSDMLDSSSSSSEDGYTEEEKSKRHALMSFAGGLGGSLLFAFSPVEWSQSTIVEIYSLNALFLMAVFLLSYRWMRKPSAKILWLTAFVFGLGLTNYQVLLLAAVPLAIIIALRDIRLFRDFILILIPVGLTAIVLKIGSMMRASNMMSAEVINKFEPILKTSSCPSPFFLWIGVILVALAPIVALVVLKTKQDRDEARKAVLYTGFAGVGAMALSAIVFKGPESWVRPYEQALAPLIEPTTYAVIGALLLACCVCSFVAALAPEEEDLKSPKVFKWLAGAAACGLVAILIAGSGEYAGAAGYTGQPFDWTKPTLLLVAGLLIMFSLVITTPRGLAYAIPVAAVQLAVFFLLKRGAMNGLTNPHSWWFIWPCVWNFVLLGLATLSLPNGRVIAPALFFAELGVSFYVYMPIVSDLRNPPMNWGYPRTWEGFKHAIMRGQYEAIGMTDVFSSKFLQQMGFYFQDLRMQFTLLAATLALIPFTFWKLVVKRAGKKPFVLRAVYVSTILYVATAFLVIESELRAGEPWGRIDKILIALMGLLVLVGVGTILVRQTLYVINMIRSRNRHEEEKTASSDVAITFGMDNVTQQWLIASGVCFAMMSILLVALANVKGDIQDGFIQKVKFISSHGMFSIWIGYGLVMGLVVANRWIARLTANVRLRKMAFIVLAVAASLTCAIPVYENYTNDKLVFAMGSAEQNGHTFGWQFGAYQLEGANAIRNELSADEEPLPNPLWPDPMDRGAVFFGGTDPGRFVPTYMIYSANYRPDVYLITQNALADDTYMSVERDLYGDEIWIPSKEDSSKSFEIYVSEVQSGKRQANADLRIENGRVQVTGALGVMEINGILTRMMFDHEKLRRAFYVEESYVIQWMYPYLTPHGLIMKINAEEGSLNSGIVRNDMDFWDWYTRRLLRDNAFRRDFPAQKSFSKLRAAIAGLYGRSGYTSVADQAFREAVLLYPASPEATFRYIQEILMPIGKWDSINDMLDYTDSVDPNNTRTSGMRNYVSRLRNVTEDIIKLKDKYDRNQASKEESMLLAQSYLSVGRANEGHKIVASLVSKPENAKNFALLVQCSRLFVQCGMRGDAASTMKKALAVMPPNVPLSVKRDMGMILADGGLDGEALNLLNEYVTAQPKDGEAILAMVYIYAREGKIREAQEMFIKAYQANAELVMTRLQNDATLQKIAEPLLRRR